MKQYNLKKLREMKRQIKEYYESTIVDSNTNNTDLYNTLNSMASSINTVTNKIAVMSDMLTDLRVINSTAKNIINLTTLPVVSNTGLNVTEDKIELAKTNSKLKEINAKLCSISSNSTYTVKHESVSSSIEDLIKNDVEIDIEFSSSNYEASINLRYSNYEQINTIHLMLGNLIKYPYINSIKYMDTSNILQEALILNTNSRSFNLDETRVLDNKYEISINTIITNQIIINFSSRLNNKISLSQIKTYYNTYITEGNVVLGPISSNSPILKLAIDSSTVSEGCTIQISTDKNNWINMDNSSRISVDDTNKIVAFNTINELSIKGEDVYNIYLKINLKSSELIDDTLPVYITLRENNTISNEALSNAEKNQISAYRYKNSDFKYGSYSYTNSVNSSSISLDKVETLEVNGVTKCIGLVSNNYTVSIRDENLSNVGVELKKKRVPSTFTISATEYDLANCNLVDVYLRSIKSEINIKNSKNLCFKLKVKEDAYKIISESKKTISIDLTTPYIRNSAAALVGVPNEDIIIKNSIGETIFVIKKEDLLRKIEDDSEYFFINLLDILFEPIKVEGYSYSKLYPLEDLSDNTYGLLNGMLVTSKDTVVKIEGYEVLETIVNHNKIVSYENGNYIKRLDDNSTYHHQQIEELNELRTVIKLDKVAIQRGSLELYEYISNNIEDYSADTNSSQKFINVGTEENPAYILADTDLNIYLQE